MPKDAVFVIVGASLAGAKAAQTLRDEGFDGRVVLIGEETERPYERPPLSKDLLLGNAERDSVYVHEAGWYERNNVELRLGTRVTALDTGAHEVELDGGERLHYDKLLLTTGSIVRTLPVPGGDLAGVHYLRRLADSDRINADIKPDSRVVIIGGGWIGLEIAAAARTRGAAVSLVEMDTLPLRRVLGDEVAQVFADLHREHEVDFHLKSGVREIRGSGSVETVVLDDGTELPADVVVAGVGIRPATELAEAAGLTVDNGVRVDAALRTADPDVYAAGDVARADHPLYADPVRVEHWANALDGGPAAAKSMLGQPVTFDKIPYFFSDQYDLGMEYSGYVGPEGYDEVVFRGDVKGREFLAFWVGGGKLLAGMNVNIWDVTDPIVAAIRSGAPVDRARLADPSVPLEDLAG
ncbi:MAG TPA: FAD-dependent oxidoreductase [Mycobacteriales bacterium]|jgi:3-phenylpropionate/trans-cinnamate dioxygenase ferredoxin reductase subunit